MAKESKGIFNGNTPQIAMLLRLAAVLVAIVLGWADTKHGIEQQHRDFDTYREQAAKDMARVEMEGCVPARSVVTEVAVMTERFHALEKTVLSNSTEQRAGEKRILDEIKTLRPAP